MHVKIRKRQDSEIKCKPLPGRHNIFNFVERHISNRNYCRTAKFGEDILNHGQVVTYWKMLSTAVKVLTLNFDLDLLKVNS